MRSPIDAEILPPPCTAAPPEISTRQSSRSPARAAHGLAGGEAVEVEADIGPARAFRRDVDDAASVPEGLSFSWT